MFETVLFYIFSAGAVAAAIGVITSRSSIYSALFLVTAMCMTAGLFVLLKAYLVATILVLVYAGAILVLFLFVVMMIDFKKTSFSDWGLKPAPILAVLASVLLFALTFQVIRSIEAPGFAPQAGTTAEMGRLLFGRYVLPFELTAFLLLAAVVSVVVLAKKDAK
ncbi:MAG: NADH-quinone oxidoreductase subunit J [Candidatus Omnitrophica bacterium]|nr:NADH-quinone oxidoreductase subunit J [Candidatus Omnitrophota bacterium]